MSTARQRQMREELCDQAKKLEKVGDHIVENTVSHCDAHDLITVIERLARALQYVSYVDAVYIVKNAKTGTNITTTTKIIE